MTRESSIGRVRPTLDKLWGNDTGGNIQIFRHLHNRVFMNMSYVEHMKSSRFCICPMRYEVNSPRIVESIYYDYVLMIIVDNFVLPFEEILNWSSFLMVLSEKYDLFHAILHSIWYSSLKQILYATLPLSIFCFFWVFKFNYVYICISFIRRISNCKLQQLFFFTFFTLCVVYVCCVCVLCVRVLCVCVKSISGSSGVLWTPSFVYVLHDLLVRAFIIYGFFPFACNVKYTVGLPVTSRAYSGL
ncbi:putative glycosyltransferase [Platanthera guangdongensis]|uniref:Glycosyltransferase n=1 Tax=Platanthera guangdongensis TaxID=2320717 RepID=A0ABR2MS52_9ASPA